ncbi:MAG: outer membrane beta-barrel protein [Myxococcales bacterium]|nr:outer membrane beta-barrel protein [Myxococcales bacterium]
MHQELKYLSLLALAAGLLSTTTAAHAEEPATRVGVDAGLALPIGKLSDGANLGLAGLVRVEHRIVPALDVTARLGAIYFLPKDAGGIKVSLLAIPLLVGVRVPFGEGPFVTGEVGLTRVSAHASGTVAGVDASGSSDAEFKGTLLVGGGYRFGAFDVKATFGGLDLGHFGDTLFLGVNAGYNFAAF